MFFFDDWFELWQESDLNGEPYPAYVRWLEMYTEPHRFYHGLEHITDGLRMWDLTRRTLVDQVPLTTPLIERAFRWAWLFHDSDYSVDPLLYPGNESRSAVNVHDFLIKHGVAATYAHLSSDLVLDTAHQNAPRTSHGKAMADIDLACSFGQPWPVFMRNARNIRAEFASVPDEEFWPKHLAVLRGFASRTPFYYLPYFNQQFGDLTRENVDRRITDICREHQLM